MSDMSIVGAGVSASAIFTPAAAAYGAGAIIDVAKELVFTDKFGQSVPPGSLIRILQSIIKIDQTALQASEGAYAAQLYSVTPPSAQADQAVWTLASADLPSYRGALALGAPVDLGAACYVKQQLADQQDYKLAGNSLFMRLTTTPGVTFTAVARQVFFHGLLL